MEGGPRRLAWEEEKLCFYARWFAFLFTVNETMENFPDFIRVKFNFPRQILTSSSFAFATSTSAVCARRIEWALMDEMKSDYVCLIRVKMMSDAAFVPGRKAAFGWTFCIQLFVSASGSRHADLTVGKVDTNVIVDAPFHPYCCVANRKYEWNPNWINSYSAGKLWRTIITWVLVFYEKKRGKLSYTTSESICGCWFEE